MARVLKEENHSLTVHDPVSGSAVTLHYRRPTSEERVAYQLSAFRLEGGQRRFCLGETRLKFGLEILTGFGSGDFLVAEEGGEAPLDPERHPDWKERVEEHAPDLVAYLAQQIFEGLRVVNREEQECF
ncbi:MAG: hypothetical protein PHU44_06700 [Syntrophales bacterium]|nr:hypothetical protein [Syntrophales bacterium]MDD5641527.1 hypothetical protein [Syntrophales bacterium]